MGTIFQPPLVKLTAGLLIGDGALLAKVKARLERQFGRIDAATEPWEFIYTDYYRDELGDAAQRLFVSFEGCMSAEDLASVKHITNAMEQEFSSGGKRGVNIDPGYVASSKLVVATTKDGNYRVSMDKGILGQSMLYFEKGSYRPWPWTYADYKDERAIAFFNAVRNQWQGEAKEGKMEPLKSQKPARWYQTIPYLVLMLFFVLGPFALPLLWKSNAVSRRVKIVLTILTLGWTVYMVWYIATKGQVILNMYKDMNKFALDGH